jgi:sporulation protein YlmC with PRC-barrel domain
MRELELRKMLGARVVDSEGEHIGRLEEIVAERGEQSCEINSYIVEHRGLLDRISSWALTSSMRKSLSKKQSSQPYRVAWNQMDLSDPHHPRTLVPKDLLERMTSG